MTTQANTPESTVCKCGNCPAIRAARGLLPFCRMPTPARTPGNGFATRAEAEAARKPGQSIVAVRAGMGHGPRGYIVRGKAA